MRKQPEQASGVDFGKRNIFNDHLIAEKVMWPLVDTHAKNWRKKSYVHDMLQIPAHGWDGPSQVDALLGAVCRAEQDDESGVFKHFEVALEVRTHLRGKARDIMLEIATDILRNTPDMPDELPAGKAKLCVAKKVVAYSFHSDGDLSIQSHGVVETAHHVIWIPPNESEAEGIHNKWLQEHDMRAIKAGCTALKAPKPIRRALREISRNPVAAPIR